MAEDVFPGLRSGPRALALAALLAAPACDPGGPPDEPLPDAPPPEVSVWTDRDDAPFGRVLAAFEERAGVRVAVSVAPASEILARMAAPPRDDARGGAALPDLIVVDDASLLMAPAVRDLLSPVETRDLEEAVPEGLRDPDGRWWGVAQRATVLAHRCGDEAPASLADLGDPAWADRVLLGAEGPTTPASLVTRVLARHGEDVAEAWAEGLADALARPATGDDGDQVEALRAGEGDVAVVDSRALARRAATTDAGEALCVRHPDQDAEGAPMTLAGAAVAAGAARRDLAVRLLEHLVAEEAQTALAWRGHEYPVRADVPWSPALLEWGAFRADTIGPDALRAAGTPAAAILQGAADEQPAEEPDEAPRDPPGPSQPSR